MKNKPTKEELRIMWAVATSSAIETRQKPYEIFANLIYSHLVEDDTFPKLYYPTNECGRVTREDLRHGDV
jgi:hypothetical protein